MIKFTVLQEIINIRYNVYQHLPQGMYSWRIKDNSIVTETTKIDEYLNYDIKSEIEVIDREVIDEFKRNDMVYKIGDKLWCKNEVYKIKDIICTYDEIKLYINKQRLNKEINKKESEELLKEIKIKQKELIEENQVKEQEKEEIDDILKEVKEEKKKEYKNFKFNIKKLFKRRKS